MSAATRPDSANAWDSVWSRRCTALERLPGAFSWGRERFISPTIRGSAAQTDEGDEETGRVAAQQEDRQQERQDESGQERQGQARHHGALCDPKPDLGRPETGSRTRLPVPTRLIRLDPIGTGDKR